MVKRRQVVKTLRDAGFYPDAGKGHEHWTDGVRWTQVPRHAEISEQLFEKIKKQAGLK
ncbi:MULTISPECIES: type II toxin-antitoxin system HicA family toxin [unclassified Adlercreutzia]|uniref:type II toxin-antitoxin system HicA family toxin n=1 Tax=unclassified Adlercreutzia TaxID=2636013 RepID=UPI0013EAFC01|nr:MULTISPECIES: type II toxin-antitoxin system HicA family toxin [unclassified Adlercreutzia]